MRTLIQCAPAALGIALLVSACSKKPELTPSQAAQKDMTQFQAEIRKIVQDPARADSLVAMTNEFQTIVAGVAARDSAAMARIGVLTREYSSTRAQFDSMFSASAAERAKVVPELAALRSRMAAVATDAEWQQLKSARLKLSEAEVQALEY